ncbi:erythromycin esterase family protein [Sulfitobacter sp. TBRI5]|uniref:erythromycin esterase family protein n=1 Tax=Sulfitobacter sp. TBRI5 TaxID=2989732 RepID=UPI003D9B3CD9
MFNSIAEVLSYLDNHDPSAAALARRRYECLAPWSNEPAAYGREALSRGYAMCEEPVTRVLVDFPPNGFKPPASSRFASANLF